MQPFHPNWKLLEELRQRFLEEKFSGGSYWKDWETLVQYDHTFAERIGWKWRAVLDELAERQCAPLKPITLVDWGCGTGIASRTFLQVFDPHRVAQVALWDRSPLAMDYSKKRIQDQFSHVEVINGLDNLSEGHFFICISHVLNELPPRELDSLLRLAHRAEGLVWIEPGTPKLSQALIRIREQLRGSFEIVAPCPHQEACGLIAKNSQDWCHFFAPPPSSVFQSSQWSEFSQRLGIDLRALPTSFLVGVQKQSTNWVIPKLSKTTRVLGRARHYRGYSQALTCSSAEVTETKFMARDQSQAIEIMKQKTITQWVG